MKVAGRSALTREEIATLRTIGEVADLLELPQHVLRFWETRFKEIEPVKRAGGRRYYRPRDIELVEAIRHLLYREGYTIKGVQRILAEQGVDAVIADVVRRRDGEPATPAPAQEVATPTPSVAPALEPPAPPEALVPPEAPAPLQATLDLPEPGLPQPAPEPPEPDSPPPEPMLAAPIFPPAPPRPVFNAPVIVTRRLDQEQAQLLREVLAEIEECKRLLSLTRR